LIILAAVGTSFTVMGCKG